MSVGSIPFTQFKRPNGRRVETSIDRPIHVVHMAHALIEAGARFEIEVTSQGLVHADCSLEDDEVLANCVVPNDPQVPEAIDAMIARAHTAFFSRSEGRA